MPSASNEGKAQEPATAVESAPEQPAIQTLRLKIQLPKSIPGKPSYVEVETTLDETLSQLRETLSLIPRTETLTNYNVYCQDVDVFKVFHDFSTFEELVEGLGLSKSDPLVLTLKEKPYNLSGVYTHLLKFRQVIGLHYLDKATLDFGVSGGVSKFNDIDLTEPKKQEPVEEKDEKADEKEEAVPEVSAEEKATISSIVASLVDEDQSAKYNELSKFNSPYKSFKLPIKSLGLSQWSPVPPQQRLKGDLLYLTLTTLENETFQITCHRSGFFVNKSSTAKFNPLMKVDKVSQKAFILFDLVKLVSPSFEKVLIQNLSNLNLNFKNPESYLIPSNCSGNYPWIVNNAEDEDSNIGDLSQNFVSTLDNGADGVDILKDWNEEFQSIKELPKTSINERILRDKLLFKLISDFNKTATTTAINIVNGDLTAINISSDPYELTYLRNGIFYSFSIDATGGFQDSGEHEAARYTSAKDLNAIKLLNRFDTNDVHNLLTCIVDYMGKRIICQAPIPGIFQELKNETDLDVEKVIHGLTSDNSAILFNENFNNSLKSLAENFHLKPHSVELAANNIKCDEVLLTPKDIKGINGTDGRKYIIDLFRTTPLDIEFIEKNYNDSNKLSYPHKETLVRHEAVEEWWKRGIASLFKLETEKLEKNKDSSKSDSNEKPQVLLRGDEVSVNPDAFTGINESETDQEEVRQISKFILTLVDEFLEETSSQLAPFDGAHLSTVLHRFGINLRYLGYIANQCLVKQQQESDKIQKTISENEKLIEEHKKEEQKKEEQKEDKKEDKKEEENKEETKTSGTFEPIVANYNTVFGVALQEMVARGTKHVLRKLSRDLPVPLMGYFTSHFFNCLFGNGIHESPICFIDEDLKFMYEFKDFEFTKLTHQDVVNLITNEVFIRFRFNLPKDWISTIKPVQLFREISIKFGIQWKYQDYGFTKELFEKSVSHKGSSNGASGSNGKKKKSKAVVVEKSSPERQTIFTPDDILTFVPIVKDSSYKSSILEEILETAKAELNNDKANGLLLLNELLTFYEQIFGRVHPETVSYYGFLSQVYCDMNLLEESCKMSRVSCILNERIFGFDSHHTITSYINSGFYESSNKDIINSLKLYQHAIELWSATFGVDHPSFITTFANLGDALSNLNLFDLSNKLYEKSLALSDKLMGQMSEVTGLIHYRYGINLIKSNKFKAAQTQFDGAHDIFNKMLGPKDHFTEKSLTYATNLNTYIQYQKSEAAKSTKSTQAAKPAVKSGNNSSKSKKGKKPTTKVDETIATQSVDDILAFIEGTNKSKKTKSKK